jgi:hypothetical protein
MGRRPRIRSSPASDELAFHAFVALAAGAIAIAATFRLGRAAGPARIRPLMCREHQRARDVEGRRRKGIDRQPRDIFVLQRHLALQRQFRLAAAKSGQLAPHADEVC